MADSPTIPRNPAAPLSGASLTEAEAALAARSHFFATASHDLRQPLHAMTLFLAQLQQRPLDEESARLVSHLSTSTQAMEALLDRLLRITRLDAGMLAAKPSDIPVSQMWSQLEAEFGPTARHQGLRFKLRPSRMRVHCDPAMLYSLLAALVSNALSYTDQGGVLVAARRRGDQLRIEVRDSGIGIAPELLPLVFDDFAPLPRRQAGKGLGLALVRRLAALLGLALDCRSQPDQGSLFAVLVPLASSPVGAERQSSPLLVSPPQAAPASPMAGRQVLLIGAEAPHRTQVVGLLESWGCRVRPALSEEQAMAMIHGDGNLPELVIIGLSHADATADAIGVIARLRHQFGEQLSAMLTGEVSGESQALARDAGLTVLAQPVAPAKLRALVQRLLTSR